MKAFKLRITEIDDYGRTKTLRYKGPTVKIEIDDYRTDPTEGRLVDRGLKRIVITIPANELDSAKKRYRGRNLKVL